VGPFSQEGNHIIDKSDQLYSYLVVLDSRGPVVLGERASQEFMESLHDEGVYIRVPSHERLRL
jgi:hypothetical protein